MTRIEECINLITNLYERFYGNTDELKEKFIDQYYFSSIVKKNSLIMRYQIDYDFLLSVSGGLGIEKDDYRLKTINEYCEYFKYATILLSNNVYNWDFLNPINADLTVPRDVEEARMYLFAVPSPEEANEKMNVLWRQKKEIEKKEIYSGNFNKNEESDHINEINKQLDDLRGEFATFADNVGYCYACIGQMALKIGKLGLAMDEIRKNKTEEETIDNK